MSKEFEISREVELAATPQEVFDAVTTGTAGWLWPMEVEPREGGRAPFGGTVTAWAPLHRYACRIEGENGWFNNLDHVIAARTGGSYLRYVHSGIFAEDWDTQYDGASKSTDFYLHTLGQYVKYFTARPAAYAAGEAGQDSVKPEAFRQLCAALGVGEESAPGESVQVAVDGLAPVAAIIDYHTPYFLGLRSEDALYRFFGRNLFGAPVAIGHHLFNPDVDQASVQLRWQAWLNELYSPVD